MQRVIFLIVFGAVMYFVVAPAVTFVTGLGFIPWAIMMALLFWYGLRTDNRERAANGEPPWTIREAIDASYDFCLGKERFLLIWIAIVLMVMVLQWIVPPSHPNISSAAIPPPGSRFSWDPATQTLTRVDQPKPGSTLYYEPAAQDLTPDPPAWARQK